ncbi:hypothetical protein LPJ56_005281, partial [Coemansia sp. RSA 2599]
QLANSRSTAFGSSGDDSGYVTSNARPLSTRRTVARISSTRSVRPMPEIDELRRRSQLQSLAAQVVDHKDRDSLDGEKRVVVASEPTAEDACVCRAPLSWCARDAGDVDQAYDLDRGRRWSVWRVPRVFRRSHEAAGVRIDRPDGRAGRGRLTGQNRQANASRLPDPSAPSQRRYSGVGEISPGAWPSLTSSWGHIYHSHARTASTRRTTRVRDVLVYPFRLSYNCMLWWLAPCISETRT